MKTGERSGSGLRHSVSSLPYTGSNNFNIGSLSPTFWSLCLPKQNQSKLEIIAHQSQILQNFRKYFRFIACIELWVLNCNP